MGWYALLAVGGGAALGAWSRWGLGILLNPLFPTLPLGTLAANLAGGYLIGVAIEYFFHNHALYSSLFQLDPIYLPIQLLLCLSVQPG